MNSNTFLFSSHKEHTFNVAQTPIVWKVMQTSKSLRLVSIAAAR